MLETYKAKRRLVQAASTLVIIGLPFLNILRLDVPTLRFYFFTTALWVDEFYLLFLVLMLLLWVIVIVSMLYGRVWCGWMCPQTVLNEMHRWFAGRMRKAFRVPKAGGPLWRRAAAHAAVGAAAAVVSLLIGFNLVAYFVDPYRMLAEIASFSLGPVTTGILLGIAALMLADVLFWREKFCTKACPYGMFQFVITDSKTQIVRYHAERDAECISCNACVRDCIMGIDIRTSPYQTECIHCGDCVDSCTAILARLKQPLPTLITFSWGEKEAPKTAWYQKLGFVDAKRWAILGLTAVYAVVLAAVIGRHQPLSLSAQGDRSTLYHVAGDGRIYNEYAVRISNRSMNDGWFRIACGGDRPPGAACSVALPENPLFLRAREVKTLTMSIYTSGGGLKPGPNRVELTAVNTGDETVHTQSEIVFFMPEPPPGPPGDKGSL
jgi:cytochrome c oxidase accessory protein FixG